MAQKIKYRLGLILSPFFLFLSLWYINHIHSELFAVLGVFAGLMALSASPGNTTSKRKSTPTSDI
jgi:hypothetical protein